MVNLSDYTSKLDASSPARLRDTLENVSRTAAQDAVRLDTIADDLDRKVGTLSGCLGYEDDIANLTREAQAHRADAEARRATAVCFSKKAEEVTATMATPAGKTATARPAPATERPLPPDDADETVPQSYSACGECGDPLEKPVTDPDYAICRICTGEAPPQYWMGALAKGGGQVDHADADGFHRLQDLAIEALDLILERGAPRGEVFISLPDGHIVDARDWIEQPENLELAGGRDQFAGRGEFDPAAPDQCWFGQSRPDGHIVRPTARAFEDVSELASFLCKEVFEGRHWSEWMDRERQYTVMVPCGHYVDAYDWVQQPETRRLAGCTTVRNRVQFRATSLCSGCGESRSTVTTQLLEGKVGEQIKAAAAIYCEPCDRRLPPTFVPVTLVNDATGASGAAPRDLT